jgi:hypothetical protein
VIVERRFKVLILVIATTVQSATAAQQGQQAYTLTITKEAGTFVNLKAKDAKLADVAADLGRRLNAKVIVGPSLKDEKISVDIAGTPIEPATLALAPRVYIDSEVRKDTQPVVLGIYLLGLDDPLPPASAVVQGTSQGLFVSGNTEDTGQPPKDAPLRIIYNKGRLTLFAKQQPLIAVVLSVADELGVPAEVKYESREVISADIKETPMIEEALVSLSENVRVYVRSNASGLDRMLLRVVIVGPTAK